MERISFAWVIYALAGAATLIYVIQNIWNYQTMPHSTNRSVIRAGQTTPAEFSFYFLGSIMQTEHPKLDSFDLFYQTIPEGSSATVQLNIVNRKIPEIAKVTGYRRDFSLALVSLARLLLEPKKAVEEHGTRWASRIDMNAFRTEFRNARTSLRASGDIGHGILNQLNRVSERIDENHDGEFSDREIETFLNPKLSRFQRPTN